MSTATVTTQAELDAALADADVTRVDIKSDRGVWIRIGATSGKLVSVYDNATVVSVYDNATVKSVYDNATVEYVSGNATVEYVSGNATVKYVYDNATVKYVSGNATVEYVSGNATVEYVYDNATVVSVSGNATVEYVSGNATVKSVYGNATVEYVSDNATVKSVYDNATVKKASGTSVIHGVHGHSTVNAGPHVAVYLHSATATVSGGVLIDLTALDLEDPATWCEHNGVTVADGTATVYKAVNDEWTTDRGYGAVDYSPGSAPSAPDWRADNSCGGGLHFGPTPRHARQYHREATRFLACPVAVADLRPILGGTAKCKAPLVLAPGCVEVTIDGDLIVSEAVATDG